MCPCDVPPPLQYPLSPGMPPPLRCPLPLQCPLLCDPPSPVMPPSAAMPPLPLGCPPFPWDAPLPLGYPPFPWDAPNHEPSKFHLDISRTIVVLVFLMS